MKPGSAMVIIPSAPAVRTASSSCEPLGSPSRRVPWQMTMRPRTPWSAAGPQ
ncbi:MAG TPA: hypothetical protein VFI88_05350 [Sphingomicrobium sp.]|nr:hypothetical protein [Sphingomicrobium sp.]